MGLVAGTLLGLGLMLCWAALTDPGGQPSRFAAARSRRHRANGDLLARAGLPDVSPRQIGLAQGGAAAIVGLLVLTATGTAPVAAAFALFAALAPRAFVRRRARARTAILRDAWPDVVDNLASAVRAGLSLPEALGELGQSGPVLLRPAFSRFAEAHRVSGAFGSCLDALAAELADPVADRVVEALRLAREVGGTDLGGLLRTLSAFLREDARTRAELEARQSWTVNAARLAVAAPWGVLLLLATQTSTIRAYNRPSGVFVLAAGGALSWIAYQLMRRLGRLPEPRRMGRVSP